MGEFYRRPRTCFSSVVIFCAAATAAISAIKDNLYDGEIDDEFILSGFSLSTQSLIIFFPFSFNDDVGFLSQSLCSPPES